MPISKKESKGGLPVSDVKVPTGGYSVEFAPPARYKPIQCDVPMPTLDIHGVPSISSRDLNYFFNLASSLYDLDSPAATRQASLNTVPGPAAPAMEEPQAYTNSTTSQPLAATIFGPAAPSLDAPPTYGVEILENALDPSAVLVLWLFRRTRIDIRPVAESFHLGPADRQPLYSLDAQPSIRSATEFNTLVIKRRDPVGGVWHATCTADVEPALDLVRPGIWTVAKLVMDAIPVWKKVVEGKVVKEAVDSVYMKGNTLRLSWGDRQTLGYLGDAYGLWWETGHEGGLAEAFYLVERWRGFDQQQNGIVRIKPALRDGDGNYQNPRVVSRDLGVVYFHLDGKTPPRFVSADPEAHIRLDIIMSGLMTVLVIETRKAAVIKENGSLPAYHDITHFTTKPVEEGEDLGWGTELP